MERVAARVGLDELTDDLASHLDRVARDGAEIVVARPDRPDLVILPLAELESLRETAHLLGSVANAQRLAEGIAELDAGGGVERVLIDP